MPRVEGADISIQDFLAESESSSQNNLQKSFNKTSILLTGVTSFIGSVVLEKLLRSCGEIDCIYVLIRNKDGKGPVDRMKEIFRSPLFDRLKMEHPTTMNKVHVIPCNFFENDLGISNDDYLMLTSNTNVVIHVARLIGSTVKLKDAVLINIKALQSILKLCYEMKKLDALAYISSIYAHYNETIIEEKLYPCSLRGDGLISMAENLLENTLEAITPGVQGDYPDISTLTLAVAERILNEKGQGLPVCIIRPSFVLASCNEPLAGWIKPQRQGTPTDILLNIFLGKIFTIHYDGRNVVQAVPVDKLANLIIAATGNLLLRRKEWTNQPVIFSNNLKRNPIHYSDFQDIQIYNIALSSKRRLTWSEFFNSSIEHVKEVPFQDTIWYAPLKINKYWIVHWLITMIHLAQLILLNQTKRILGFKSELSENTKAVQEMSDKVLRFCKKHWLLKDDNVVNLWESISESDRGHFDFNVKSLDWNQFFYTQCRGLRVYLMKDPLSTVPEAQKKRRRVRNTYNFLTTFIIGCCLFIVYKFILV